MVDAAVGGKAVVAFGVESSLGIRGGALYPSRFISTEFSRDSKENPSTAITGHGGRDRGTPGAVEFAGKEKVDMTAFRFALRLAAMYGKPAVTAMKHVASVTVSGSGTSYTSTVTFSGGGADVQATGHATLSSGNVLTVVVDTPGSGYTSVPTVTVASGTGQTFTAVMSSADAWLAKFRPGQTVPVPASLFVYIDEGGSYSATLQNGRRPQEISITEDANKRLVLDATYAPATGDTISGFPIAKTGNAGSFTIGSTQLGKVQTRGRRPTVTSSGSADPNWSAGKSLYLKCTASDTNTITFKAAFDTASGATDGSGFPSTSFGSTTFVVRRPASALAPDGYVAVVLSDGTLVGQFGENNEPYELTFGDQDLSLVSVNDVFEIPYQLPAGGVSLSPLSENRLSAFHLVRTIGGNDTKFDSGTVKLSRPYSPYYTNARKLPSSIDPTGDLGAEISFKKRLFDRFYRQEQEQAQRFTIEDVLRFNTPIVGSIYEGVHAFFPQGAVTTMKSGDISTKDTLEETITIEVEQPDAAPTPPSPLLSPQATFDADASFVMQINVVSRIDLSAIAAS